MIGNTVKSWEELVAMKKSIRIPDEYDMQDPLPLSSILDPRKSALWNYHQVLSCNEEIFAENKRKWEELRRKEREWQEAVLDYIQTNAIFVMPRMQAQTIWKTVYNEQKKDWDAIRQALLDAIDFRDRLFMSKTHDD